MKSIPFHQKIIRAAGLAACLAMLTGCHLEDIIHWSPDGQHALVRGGKNDGYLVDPTGKILGNSGGATVWMPDSRHAAGVRTVNAHDWEEYAGLLGKDRAEDVARAGEELLSIFEAYKGVWADFEKSEPMVRWEKVHLETLLPASYYLAQKRSEAFAPMLRVWQEGNHAQNEITGPIYELFIRDVLPGEPPEERVLLRAADPILDWLKPAPGGKTIAFASVDARQSKLELQVIPTEGGTPSLVDEGAAQADWSPDGERLVYAKPTGNEKGPDDDARLGAISRRQICDHSGAILAEFGTIEDLAGIIFAPSESRVACLPDGRILFASLALQLPAVDKDMPKTTSLFTLQPEHTPAIKRVVSDKGQKLMPSRADCFVLSPDASQVAIPGEKGELALVSLATGEVTKLQGAIPDYGDHKKLENDVVNGTLPSWRNAKELAYVVGRGAKGGSAARAEVVLRKIGGEARVISKTWSDAMTNDFLPRLKK